MGNAGFIPSTVVLGRPLKGTLLNLTYGSLKGDLIERVYIPKASPNPKSLTPRKGPEGCL